ncbi:MAG: hypothetical protein C0603_10540 [Denitrovibrio sp.]|nr:MAG: hypothetical protein C0603_10540 [Denitrovibrio sp.]
MNDKGLDIKCFKLIPYRLNEEVIIDVQQMIPLPEAKDYQNKIKEQKEERRETRESSRDYTRYTCDNIKGLTKRGLVFVVWTEYLKSNSNITMDKLESAFPKDIRGKLFVTKEHALDQQKRNNRNINRYFLESEAVVEIDEQEYVISNQWGKDNISRFIECARKLGYTIDAE